MTDIHEGYTPVEAETKLKQSANRLSVVTLDFARANDALTDASIAHWKAVTAAEFHPDCPRVVRGEVTVADREAWINQRTEPTRCAELAAEAMRDTALEMLRTARKMLDAAMALNASARAAYQMAVPV